MNTHNKWVSLILLLGSPIALAAEDVASKPGITLDGARRAADASAAYARANGAPGGAIAVVDESGALLYFLRLDGTFTASANISIGKAKTAAVFRKPSAEFEAAINKGRFSMTALPPDFTPLQGGVPIKMGNDVIGAIGVSGAKSAQQDEEVALAGAQVFATPKTAQK